jgi:NhaC family Na+:H+ antiporter
MDVVIAFAVFPRGHGGLPHSWHIFIIAAIIVGWAAFVIAAMRRGVPSAQPDEGLRLRGEGQPHSRAHTAHIGMLTASWRAGGTIMFFVYYGMALITPKLFHPADLRSSAPCCPTP